MSLTRAESTSGKPELIVVLRSGSDEAVPPQLDNPRISSILLRHNAKIRPIANMPTGPVPPTAAHTEPLRKLQRYHHVASATADLETLRSELAQEPSVEAAYIKPPGQPPSIHFTRYMPSPVPVGSSTPDFTSRQGYLAPAPTGVDALFAWQLRGGTGAGVRIIDCEWSWNFGHEDLAANCGGPIIGTPAAFDDSHGTAVIGTIIGNANGFGITGVAPGATLSTACFGDSAAQATSQVILQAADQLSAGDIILLEIHRPGPMASPGQGQFGFIPIEWWPDDFHAIAYATAKGIIVVEAGGNGSQNLDDPLYAQAQAGFPADWQNPFGPQGPDSGAIIVGAGNPPAGTHGRFQDSIGFNETYVDRARCVFSNFGARIDCQGWGWEVTTLSTGDLFPGAANGGQLSDRNRLYTDTFDGTSSASPIVTGVAACVQGALRAAGRTPLDSRSMRQLLRTTGSPQQSGPNRPSTQRIGSRPDLKQIFQVMNVPTAEQNSPSSPITSAVQVSPPSSSMRVAAFAAYVAGVAALLVILGMGWLADPTSTLAKTPFAAWLCELGLVTLLFLCIGNVLNSSWLGITLDWRRRISLARLQITLWTILFVSTLLVAFVWNVAHTGKVSLQVPTTAWLLMGISAVSAVGAPLILNNKAAVNSIGAPLPPPGMFAAGVVVARPANASPEWADLVLGDELGNATAIDISKVQQLLLSAVAIIVYALAIGHLFLSALADSGPIKSLPDMDTGFIALLAASHATYLAYKAVPQT